jgi:hypothetical protein
MSIVAYKSCAVEWDFSDTVVVDGFKVSYSGIGNGVIDAKGTATRMVHFANGLGPAMWRFTVAAYSGNTVGPESDPLFVESVSVVTPPPPNPVLPQPTNVRIVQNP